MKPRIAIFVASFVLGLSVCSTSFADSIPDPTVQKDAAAELASLSQQISANPKIQDKDKDKALKKAVEQYVDDQKKVYSKERDHEASLEKDQRKLEDQAKDKARQAGDKDGAISYAKESENKVNRGVEVANTVEDMYRHPQTGVIPSGGDSSVQQDAAAELASLKQQVSGNPKIQDKDKDKALKAAVEGYVKDQKKAYSKEKDEEESLEKDQRKLEDQAKEKERQAEDKNGAISNAKATQDKDQREVDVANTVEEMYKHPVAGVILTSDSK